MLLEAARRPRDIRASIRHAGGRSGVTGERARDTGRTDGTERLTDVCVCVWVRGVAGSSRGLFEGSECEISEF